jgi:hypothetical protein
MLTITERRYSTFTTLRITRGDTLIAVHTSSDKVYLAKMIARYARSVGGIKHQYAGTQYTGIHVAQ